MSTILNISQIIGQVASLEDVQSVSLTFDFQLQDGHMGAIFRACNDIFMLTINKNRVTIANNAAIIDEPIELQDDEEYRAECGVKMDYTFSYFILYVRIWQEIEIPQAFYDAFKTSVEE